MKAAYITSIIAALLAIAGCATTTPANTEFERITSKDQYLELVAGKLAKMKGTNFTSTAFADGTMSGGAGDRKFSGTWEWEGEHFCREGMLGSKKLEHDCQLVEIADDTLRVTRNKGAGEKIVMKLK